MKENKNIDRLFQEKLKNLDASPSNKVWKVIKSELNTTQKRAFPFWWFSSGVAAMLFIGFFLLPFSENKNLEQNQRLEVLTNTPQNKIKDKIKLQTEVVFKEENITKEKITSKNSTIKDNSTTIEKAPSIIAENKEEPVLKRVLKVNEKENTLDSKIAMEKIFLSNDQKNSVIQTKSNVKLLFTPKKDFLAVIKDKDSLKIKVLETKKWAVSPSLAVLNSNSFSKNSSLDQSLNNKNTSGENTFSYGIKIAYQINKKWALQSGIHLQEIGFSTKDVFVSTNFSRQSSLRNVSSSASVTFDATKTSNINSAGITEISEQANISQRFGYIEVPLELKYSLINSTKIKTEIVTGFSSLFLNKNNINLSSNNFSGSIGEANNLNRFNFSGNIGFDFNYEINKNLFLNLNPMFKTHLNTFSKNSNGFKPYFFGVYSGVKYQF